MNLNYLIEHQADGKWSQTKVGDIAGVSQRTISNMRDPEGPSPVVENVEAVAAAFGLEGWHLIMPSLIEDLESDTSIRRIYDAYMESNQEGRRHIQRVAEREAEYQHRWVPDDPPARGSGG